MSPCGDDLSQGVAVRRVMSIVQLQENGVMGRSLMTLMASGLGGFGLYTEIIGLFLSPNVMEHTVYHV